jgi:hypothetical protein
MIRIRTDVSSNLFEFSGFDWGPPAGARQLPLNFPTKGGWT